MTLAALSTGAAILAWVVVVVALAGALAAVALLQRVVGPALEIERYAEDVGDAIEAIERNAAGAGELRRTRELAERTAALVAPGAGA